MASNLIDVQAFEELTVGVATFIAGIFAVYHFIFRRGQAAEKETNIDSLIENRIASLEQRLDKLEEDIKDYRKDNSQKLDKIIENQAEMRADVAYMKGKMTKRDKSSSSS